MRVLMLTQKVDRDDDMLGFTHDWIAALAARVDVLEVIALGVGRYRLPDNVHVMSMGKERGAGRPDLLAAFYRYLIPALGRVDTVFVHMIPLYAVLAAPLARLSGKPITLWYTHRNNGPLLRMATPLVNQIATAHPSSFPITSPKVHALGHGIDTETFTPEPDLPEQPPMVVSLARLSPIKHHETLIRAAALLRDKYDDPPVRVVIAGGKPSGTTGEYEDFLESEIDRLRLNDRVSMWGAIPPEGVTGVFHDASLALNASPPGLFDKAALEGMLCGVPTIVANPAFDELLGDHVDLLRIPSGDDTEGLAERLAALLQLSPAELRAIGLEISARTAAAHSLDGLMDRLVALLRP